MPITSADILFKYSTKNALSGNSVAQDDPNLSLGYFMSSSILATGLNGLFDDISASENEYLDQEYRCIFIHNSNTSSSLISGVIFISGEVAGGADMFIGVDPFPASIANSTSQQAVSGIDEDTSPTGVTFSNPTSYSSGLSIGNLQPNFCKGIWIKRVATNSVAMNNDGGYIVIQGESTG